MAICIFLLSCEEEELLQLESNKTNPEYTINYKRVVSRVIKWEEFISESKINGESALFEAFRLSNSSLAPAGLSHKSAVQDHYVLDVDHIEMMSVDGVATYTFAIQQWFEGQTFKNLVVRQIDGENIRADLITYMPTQEWLESDEVITPFAGRIQRESFDGTFTIGSKSGAEDCFLTFTILWECDAGLPHSPETSHRLCTSRGAEVVGIEIGEEGNCSSGTNGGGTPDGSYTNPEEPDYGTGPDNGGESPGGSNGNDDGSTSNNLPTKVKKPFTLPELFLFLLDAGDRSYITHSDQREQLGDILTYLHGENYSLDARDFAIEAIKTRKEDEDTEVDFENKSIETSSIPDCVKNIINDLKPTNGNPGFNVSDLDDVIKNQLNLPLNPNGLANFPGGIIAMFNNDQNYGLKFKVGHVDDAPNGAFRNAITETGPTASGGRMSTITLNQDYVNRATDLAIARTLILELMHAYISYSINNNANGFIGSVIDNLVIQAGVTRG
ncbi:hypothetical protein AAU57_02080 [Nonlabens sp. YIK11]|uniref:hypothetical protein n=1 Tax=Nonlabens sp. YIK11 TaxID=1453349 RepID=UPI0006DD0567|nr:hypothetical protein [Nonlabens sp. YIK11]KQC32246.1 hypothetical protein AAU57_02080 [Nonlabens sp. YIK11]